jgi:plasmid maintenance system antidote protein VapI
MEVSITQAAQAMAISRKTLSKIVNGRGRVTPEIAMRLSIALGSSAESWLGHQAADGRSRFLLHVERIETHTPASLAARNEELNLLAHQFGVEYDGMDAGPVPRPGPKPSKRWWQFW